MNRMFGMMPCSEIAIEKKVSLNNGETGSLGRVTIQAGKNGWTILYADHSTDYKDAVNSPRDNFLEAMEKLRTYFPEALTPEI